MALIDNIPMPGDPGSSFLQGATATQNILSKMLQGRQNQQKLSQDALSNEQLNKYRMGQLGISRMAENRAQTIMPYLLQQYKDTHNKEASSHEIEILKNNLLKQQYNEIMNSMNPQGQAQQQEPQQAQQQAQQDSPMGNENAQGGLNYTPINKQDNLASMMQPLFDKNYGAQQPQQSQQPQQQSPQPQQQQMQQPEQPQQQQAIQAGQDAKPGNLDQSGMQEITLRPAKKGMELSDKLAGTSFGKPVKTHIGKDGWVYSEYPSGKITAVRNPQTAQQAGKETPEEKRSADLKNKKEFEKFKLDEKHRENADKEMTATWKALEPTMSTINKLSNILDKKPELTGRGTQFGQWTGLTDDEDVGTFSSGALALQTGLTKDLSSRGGYGAAKIVSGSKPDIKNSGAFNKGALKEMKGKSIRTFVAMKKDFEKNHPEQPFPYKLGDYFPNVIIEKPNGEKITLPADGAVKLLEDHPNHKIAG